MLKEADENHTKGLCTQFTSKIQSKLSLRPLVSDQL